MRDVVGLWTETHGCCYEHGKSWAIFKWWDEGIEAETKCICSRTVGSNQQRIFYIFICMIMYVHICTYLHVYKYT